MGHRKRRSDNDKKIMAMAGLLVDEQRVPRTDRETGATAHLSPGQFVTDGKLLRAMARAGVIKQPATHMRPKGKSWGRGYAYVDEGPRMRFIWQGFYVFQCEYIDGCFFPCLRYLGPRVETRGKQLSCVIDYGPEPLSRPQPDVKPPMKFVHAHLETRHYDFDAYGRDAAHAEQLMKQLWNDWRAVHAGNNATMDTWNQLRGDVGYQEVFIGGTYMDRDLFPRNRYE